MRVAQIWQCCGHPTILISHCCRIPSHIESHISLCLASEYGSLSHLSLLRALPTCQCAMAIAKKNQEPSTASQICVCVGSKILPSGANALWRGITPTVCSEALVAPYCAMPRDYLSDTPPGAIPPPPFLSVSPLESMRSGGAIPPPQKGYLGDTCRIPYDNKANIARYGWGLLS